MLARLHSSAGRRPVWTTAVALGAGALLAAVGWNWQGGDAKAAVSRAAAAGLPKPLACLQTSAAAEPKPVGLIALVRITDTDPATPVVPSAVFANEAISGVQVYIGWNDLQPASFDSLDASVIHAVDEIFCEADAQHKFVVLTPQPGFYTPVWALCPGASGDWAPKLNCPAKPSPSGSCSGRVASSQFTYSYGGAAGPRQLPLPWDPTYLCRWFALLHLLDARYGANPAFSMISADGPTSVSEEMSLPDNPSGDSGLPASYPLPPAAGTPIGGDDFTMWGALGYTPAVYEAAWQKVFEQYANSFARQYVSFSLFDGLPIPTSSCDAACQTSATLDAVFGEGAQDLDKDAVKRFVFQGDGLKANNTSQHYQYVESKDGTIGATGFQTTNNTKLGGSVDDLAGALERGIAAGVNFIEFYESDVYDGDTENPGFQCALEAAAVHWKTGPVCPPGVSKPPKPCGDTCT